MTLKNIFILFLFVWLLPTTVVNAKENIQLHLSQEVYQNQDMPFTAFDSYLVMNIQLQPVAEVFGQIKQAFYPGLINRGEAHITVITPPEYVGALKSKLSMKEINQIAIEMEIQQSRFDVLGLGSGKVSMDETFFLIVQSEDLMQIRRAIQKAFIAHGGHQNAFNPEHFYPHITVGFTKRDLHESDGVIKDVEHSLDPRFTLD